MTTGIFFEIGGSNFVIIKCLSYVQKTSYDASLVKFWPINALILKVIWGNLKIGNFFVTLATLNFQELFVIEFDSRSSQSETKIFLLTEFITQKLRGGGKIATGVK